MDRRTLLAVGLSLLIFVGWQKFYIEPRLPKQTVTTQAPTENAPPPVNSASAPAMSKSAAVAPQTKAPTQINSLPISTKLGTALAGDAGKFFTGWSLNGFKTAIKDGQKQINLTTVTHATAGEGELAFDLPEYAYMNNVQGKMIQNADGSLLWVYEDTNVKMTREYRTNPEQNWVDLKVSAQFKTKRPNFAFISMSSTSPEEDEEEHDRQLVYYTGEKIHRVQAKGMDNLTDLPGAMRWIGAQNRYFLLAFVPENPAARALSQSLTTHGGKMNLVFPVSTENLTIPMKVYFGPKEMNVLNITEPSLSTTVDFGWFTVIAYPILKFMKWLYEIFKNWGIAIIVLTIVIKIITFPLTYKSMVSMKKMAKLQPEIKKLQEKHKDDKQALNQEMITFMRTNGYNPVSGCLPILIQMPVFFALYRVLYSSIELYQAPFFGWIHDLSLKDPFYITPIVLTGTMYLQQKMTPATTMDPTQQKMMQWMPVFFGLMMLSLPAGLTIYMLVNALTSIVQQMYLNKKLANV